MRMIQQVEEEMGVVKMVDKVGGCPPGARTIL